jgi:hypothetical protein
MMTLHEAIQQVLVQANKALVAKEIAKTLNENSWYTKKDGSAIESGQILLRVKNYAHLFVKSGNLISLKSETGIVVVPALPKVRQQKASQIVGSSVLIVKVLMNPKNCKTIASCEQNIPDKPGLYCIRITRPDVLAKPLAEVLKDREHDIVYIGLASQSLKKRFLGQELRAKGHGTFFRSLGAVLGYKPESGSLVEKINQNNFRFSCSDEKKIIKWIEDNLVINWVEIKDNLNGIENNLIKEYLPLLNIASNPGALDLVRQLREECKSVARGK